MRRIRPLLLAGAIAAALLSLVRGRLSSEPPPDPGGWRPVDPA